MIIGIDVGGTFTDVVLVDGDRVAVAKVSTTNDQSVGVVRAARTVTDEPARLLVHGTTVATNALLEHRGARTVLITDPGFRDLLEIGRSDRPSLYDVSVQRPQTLVPREHRFESDEPELWSAIAVLAPDVVVVALKDAYRDGDHERRLERAMRAALGDIDIDIDIVLSHQIAAEFREFERTSSAVVAGYLRPGVEHYLTELLDAAIPALSGDVLVMRSNGGVAPVGEAAANPTSILLSGPAGGTAAAGQIGRDLGLETVISFDMGGTSTDVCRIENGEPVVRQHTTVGGYPCLVPTVAIHTVGAGGGSIAWVDAGGSLRVGPQSSGAEPGPAAYRRGGQLPTVTDANVVVGRIDPNAVFGDGVEIDFDAAWHAVGELGRSIGLDEPATASGIIEVVEAHMERAIHAVSVSEGHDVRSASLIAFGGAGALHAVELARRLEMASVIVPNHAGVLSALGLLISPLRVDLVMSVDDLDPAQVGSVSDRAATDVTLRFEDQVGRAAERVEAVAMMRYSGQSHELSVPIDVGTSAEATIASFDRTHQRHNGFSRVGDPVELVAVRATALAESGVVVPPMRVEPSAARTRTVVTASGVREVPVLSRGTPDNDGLRGPAVIEDAGATIWIPEGCSVRVVSGGALELIG